MSIDSPGRQGSVSREHSNISVQCRLIPYFFPLFAPPSSPVRLDYVKDVAQELRIWGPTTGLVAEVEITDLWDSRQTNHNVTKRIGELKLHSLETIDIFARETELVLEPRYLLVFLNN